MKSGCRIVLAPKKQADALGNQRPCLLCEEGSPVRCLRSDWTKLRWEGKINWGRYISYFTEECGDDAIGEYFGYGGRVSCSRWTPPALGTPNTQHPTGSNDGCFAAMCKLINSEMEKTMLSYANNLPPRKTYDD
jgi:hypothetical protein